MVFVSVLNVFFVAIRHQVIAFCCVEWQSFKLQPDMQSFHCKLTVLNDYTVYYMGVLETP